MRTGAADAIAQIELRRASRTTTKQKNDINPLFSQNPRSSPRRAAELEESLVCQTGGGGGGGGGRYDEASRFTPMSCGTADASKPRPPGFIRQELAERLSRLRASRPPGERGPTVTIRRNMLTANRVLR